MDFSGINYLQLDAQATNAPAQDLAVYQHCTSPQASKEVLNHLDGQHLVAQKIQSTQQTLSATDKIRREREENRAAFAKAEAERKAAEKTAQDVANAEALKAKTLAEREAAEAEEEAKRKADEAKHRDSLARKRREIEEAVAASEAETKKKLVKEKGHLAVDLTGDGEAAPEAKRHKTDKPAIDLTGGDDAPPPPQPPAAAPASSDATPPTPPQPPHAGASPAPASTGQVNDPAFVGDEVSVHEVGYQPAPPGHMAAPAWRRSTKRANKSACKAGSGK